MIHTASYFKTSNHIGVPIQISRSFPPFFFGKKEFRRCALLVPSSRLLQARKKKQIDWEQYKGIYYRQLTDVTLAAVRYLHKIHGDITLLCWCKDVDRCHRGIVADWLEENGEKVIRR